MLQNAYFLAKIGADTAENGQHFAEILPTDAHFVNLANCSSRLACFTPSSVSSMRLSATVRRSDLSALPADSPCRTRMMRRGNLRIPVHRYVIFPNRCFPHINFNEILQDTLTSGKYLEFPATPAKNRRKTTDFDRIHKKR